MFCLSGLFFVDNIIILVGTFYCERYAFILAGHSHPEVLKITQPAASELLRATALQCKEKVH